MNKTELIEAVAAHTGQAKSTVAEILGGLEDIVVGTVNKGEKVALTGFVSFERVDRKARTARNPQTRDQGQRSGSQDLEPLWPGTCRDRSQELKNPGAIRPGVLRVLEFEREARRSTSRCLVSRCLVSRCLVGQ